MTLLTATRLGADAESALDPACAIEMVHTASLIVDDMPFMDDARSEGDGRRTTGLRRGRGHRLAAFDLLSRAFGVLAGAAGLDDRQRPSWSGSSRTPWSSEGVIAGQLKTCVRGGSPGHRRPSRGCTSRRPGPLRGGVEAGARVAAGPPGLDRAHP